MPWYLPPTSARLTSCVPTDAARATVLTTGTYSARLNYQVLYKTNYRSDYQLLASNLLTSSNYSFHSLMIWPEYSKVSSKVLPLSCQ